MIANAIPVGTRLLELFVVFNSPLDYPGEFVCRRTVIGVNGSEIDRVLFARARSLDAVRAEIHRLRPGLIRLDRNPTDVLSIVETWL
jgi:hypothetical protein